MSLSIIVRKGQFLALQKWSLNCKFPRVRARRWSCWNRRTKDNKATWQSARWPVSYSVPLQQPLHKPLIFFRCCSQLERAHPPPKLCAKFPEALWKIAEEIRIGKFSTYWHRNKNCQQRKMNIIGMQSYWDNFPVFPWNANDKALENHYCVKTGPSKTRSLF